MPLQATSGAASYDAFGGGVAAVPNYIEDVFSTYLYTSSGTSSQNATISNGVDFTKGGSLIWTKSRSNAIDNYLVYRDSSSSAPGQLISNSTAAAANDNPYFTYLSTGYRLPNFADSTVGTASGSSGQTFASWTFREQPKFFDVVTFTQTGGSGTFTTFNHNLGSAPGMVLLKATGASYPWFPCYHRSLGNDQFLVLNETSAAGTFANTFSVNSTSVTVNNNLMLADGATYVAYLFAHNAGGFGLSGTDNVISCGSFTTDGSGNATVDLGYEPQWVMTKRTDSTGNWTIVDSMRGMTVNAGSTGNAGLLADSAGAEIAGVTLSPLPNATGMTYTNVGPSRTFIYIAIRRGPMKVPTDGTSVFDAGTRSGSGSVAKTNSNILTDLTFIKNRTSGGEYWAWTPRLVGNLTLQSNSTDPELTGAMATNPWDTMTGAFCAASNGATNSGSLIDYSFRRAPGFHDVVCYTGDGTTSRNVNHNLGVVPEMVIVKSRSNASTNWVTGVFANGTQSNLWLNSTAADGSASSGGIVFTQFSNSTTFRLSAIGGVVTDINTTSATYVAYLFASAPGVSKVFSYTGNGSSQTINCGFTGGARFVMVKRTDSTGNWLVVDTARGLVSAGDPTLYLNSTAAEVTGVDWIDPDSSGFIVNQEGTMNANVNAATYIGIAIA